MIKPEDLYPVKSRIMAVLLPVISLLAPVIGFADEVSDEVIGIMTARGVLQPILVVKGPKPVASVILFPGGKGKLGLSPEYGFARGKNNFLVRSRQLFVNRRMLVVIVDAPSDRQGNPGLLRFRKSADHARDIAAVIAFIRKHYPGLPVWLVGTSRGSTSAANAAIRLKTNGADGLVLTSSVTQRNSRGSTVMELPLKEIHIPTLVVHHKSDRCRVTPYRGAKKMFKRLQGTAVKHLVTVTGGETGVACKGLSYHGFQGREAETVNIIVDWIKQQRR